MSQCAPHFVCWRSFEDQAFYSAEKKYEAQDQKRKNWDERDADCYVFSFPFYPVRCLLYLMLYLVLNVIVSEK